MTKKYHITDDERVLECTAYKRECEYGKHYAMKETAWHDIEKRYDSQIFDVDQAFADITEPLRKEMQKITHYIGATVSMHIPQREDKQLYENSIDYFTGNSIDPDSIPKYTIAPKTQEEIENNKEFDKMIQRLRNDIVYNAHSHSSSGSVIRFQGKPLSPSRKEVTKAKRLLEKLKVENPNEDVEYDRVEHFGNFKPGTIEKIEKRDIMMNYKVNRYGRATSGWFLDPYTGERAEIIKGSGNDVDVDHIIPLKEAFASGAWKLTQEQRERIANDPDNLILVASRVNRVKGHRDVSGFLPDYKQASMSYVIAQITIKNRYGLSVDSREKAIMQKVLNDRM